VGRGLAPPLAAVGAAAALSCGSLGHSSRGGSTPELGSGAALSELGLLEPPAAPSWAAPHAPRVSTPGSRADAGGVPVCDLGGTEVPPPARACGGGTGVAVGSLGRSPLRAGGGLQQLEAALAARHGAGQAGGAAACGGGAGVGDAEHEAAAARLRAENAALLRRARNVSPTPVSLP
jgi:hypothetical protein